MNDPALELRGLRKRFDGLTAVDDFSVKLDQGELVAVVGPNGAGKSTLLNLVSGLLRPDEGKIRVYGQDVTSSPAHEIAEKRLARGFQVPRLIDDISVTENVLLGRPRGFRDGLFAALTATWRLDRNEHEEAASAALERVGMAEFGSKCASDLSFGQRKLVMLAGLMAMEPKVLLLDEPAAGLSPERQDAMADILRGVQGDGNLVMFVEHNPVFVRDRKSVV